MRIEAPVGAANFQIPTEDISIGQGKDKFILRKNTSFMINMHLIHHDPTVWKSPEEFIPDRFNKESEWS